ncbi:MAG: PIN domain-containing protein [Opitutaceae bacterium]|nr:PIN domain-containing protein [Opitutaceae bacterium]
MDVKAIVDAGPLVGWLNADDQWHAWSVEVLSDCRGALSTTEIVLGEACWHLGGNTKPAHALLSLVRNGAVVLVQPWPEHLARTQELMLKYACMDAADASLVVLSELHPRAQIITTDFANFRLYRRFRDQPLPLKIPA